MSLIETSKDGHVGHIRFNRAERRNAFTRDMYRLCAAALRTFRDDDTVRAVILSGAGDDYCTGNDLNEFVALADPAATADILDRDKTPSTDLVHVVAEFDKPLIAAVTGRAIGWGVTMLLHCDAVVADESAELIFKFLPMGLVPEGGATRTLRDRIGSLKAARILLEGAPLGAAVAERLGLISDLVPQGQALDTATNLAHTIARHPPGAVRATLRLLAQQKLSLSETIDAEFTAFAARLADPESQQIFKKLLGPRA